MSPVIDQRVVEMGFDNARFEKNVHTSISTLDKLKAALNLDGATKGISNVESAFNKLNLGNVSSAVDKIADRFSAMGIVGMRVLENLTDKAMELGKRLMDFAVMEPMSAGWTKYADKTTAVQTIMAATQDTWEESARSLGFVGDQMEFVNSQMDKLNWFTDETSYNFVDMVSNIGKFTSNQIPLEQAVTAMQGIANWAAVSGQNASSASRAMYNLAQAIGVGSVKLMDWRSIENANMATAEFKQKVLEVAVAQGQLKEVSEGVYQTMKGTEVNIKNFSQSLSEGWFTSDVLISTLDQYGAVTDALYKFSEASGLTATEILELVEANKAGKLSEEELAKVSETTGMSLEDLKTGISVLSSEAAEFGIKVFKAAQEAKTFQDAIDATKDAASTTWMKIYENIFGDYEKARHIWTGFANFLYDELVGPLERLVDISEMLGNLNAVERLASSFMDVLTYIRGDGEEVLGILGNIRAGFEEIFEPLDDTEIYAMLGGAISAIREFSMGLEVTSEQAERLQSIGRLLGNALEYVMNSMKNLWSATEPLRDAIGDIGSKVQTIIDRFLQLHSSFDTSGVSGSVLASVCQTLADVLGTLSDHLDSPTVAVEKLVTAFHGLQNILSFIGNTFTNLFSAMKPIGDALINVGAAIAELVVDVFGLASNMDTAGASSEAFSSICQGLADFINLLADAIRKVDIDSLKEKFSSLSSIIQSVDGFLKGFVDGLKNFAETIKGAVGTAVDWVKDKFATLKESFDFGKMFKGGLGVGVLTLIATKIASAVKFIKEPLESLADLKKKVGGVLDGIKSALSTFQKSIKVDSIKKIATAILMLAGALLILGFVDYDNAIIGVGIIGTALAALLMNLEAIGKMDMGSLPKMAGVLLALAAALLLVAVAMGVMAGALAAFALVAKMKSAWTGFALMISTLAATVLILAGAAHYLEGMAGEVLAVAASLAIVAAAMLLLAAALAAFTLVAKMDGALLGFAAMLGTIAVALGGLIVAVKVLKEQTPMMLAAAGALLIAAAAIMVMAVSLGALMAVIKLVGETAALEALISLGALLVVVTAALLLLANAGPMVLAGAGSLLVAAAALLVLAAAVGVAAVAMLILGPALASFGAGIKAFVVDIGQAISGFFTSIGEMLPTLGNGIKELVVSIGEGIGETVAALGSGIGEAVSALGTGIGEAVAALGTGVGESIAAIGTGIADAISALVASIGEGIGQGLSAISTGLSDISTGISDFGESVRGLSGISWAATALGIAELAGALKKLNKKDLAGNLDGLASSFQTMITTITTSLGDASSQTQSGGQQLIQSMIDGMNSKDGEVQTSVTALMTTGKNAIEATYGDWQNDGSQLIIVVIAGMQSQSGALASAGTEISNTGSSAVMSTQGTWEYAGQMLGQGLANGLWSMLGEVQSAASALANAAAEGVESTAQINSPSKVATWEGEQYGEGMVVGIKNKIGDVKNTTSLMLSGLNKTLTSARGRISRALETGFTPTIRPVLDLSNVSSYAGSIPDLDTSVGVSRVGVIARRQNSGANQNGTEIRSGDTNNITNTIHIHQQPGQSAEELADAVERRLAFKKKQRTVAYVK